MHELNHLLTAHGKDSMNSMTKYPSILTYHKLGPGELLLPEFTTDFGGSPKYASEKVDGCNVRLIFYQGQFLIGSRENILHSSGDMYYNTETSIVETMGHLIQLYDLAATLRSERQYRGKLVVIYGEFFGGKTTSASKNYGKDAHGFRVFDVSVYDRELVNSILVKTPKEISLWRESEREGGIVYGQPFLGVNFLNVFCEQFGLEVVPIVPLFYNGDSLEEALMAMKQALPETNVALSASALKRPEGIVIRTNDRSRIAKMRFNDYERTLRSEVIRKASHQ